MMLEAGGVVEGEEVWGGLEVEGWAWGCWVRVRLKEMPATRRRRSVRRA
jgi:hypothetical protein